MTKTKNIDKDLREDKINKIKIKDFKISVEQGIRKKPTYLSGSKLEKDIQVICLKYFSAIVIPDWDKKSITVHQDWEFGTHLLEELFQSRLGELREEVEKMKKRKQDYPEYCADDGECFGECSKSRDYGHNLALNDVLKPIDKAIS